MCSTRLVLLGFHQTLSISASPASTRVRISSASFPSIFPRRGFRFDGHRCRLRRSFVPFAFSFDEDSGLPSLMEDSNGVSGGNSSYLASSEDEDSDADLIIHPTADVELRSNKERFETPDSSITVAAHRFATLRGRRKKRTQKGILISMSLVAFLLVFLLFFDWCSWRIVRMPLEPFFLTYPFTLSAALSAFAGFIFVPIVDSMRIHQVLRKEGPASHTSKRGTPTMGGLFFVPIGIIVASIKAGERSTAVSGAAVATIAFAAIGLLDDLLSCIKSHNYGLPGWAKLGLQVIAATWFSFWLDSAHISTSYNMKFLVPLPPPMGIMYLGKFYPVLTVFCFASMTNGVNLTDGLDGLAGGCAALAFIGMSVAVLAICPDLAVFGSSMAGACVGFLFHNRYKASVFMGDTGSLALGGALAAMAALSGMFFPLFIASGTFLVEVLSVIVQVLFKKATEVLYGTRRRIFLMAPIHHHFELCGITEPIIVAGAYVLSFILAIFAGYVGLFSA
ncbi:phospho-N-acetylmuramoyl-pentapeptide-transferase homolog [Musa acuminata AAA Group]|uniref:phospho-N-acetylmuramoyl-pentapeptide- transferase homolog n=1 Tax=Musa acuminata AAA Group TaxID=214697 RepID=UPI0031E1448A